jgi:phosphoglycolate phosphatase
MPELQIDNQSYAISGILFDKDGTLLDFVSMWGRWSELLLGGFLRRLGKNEFAIRPELIPHLFGTVHDIDGTITDYDRNGPLAMGSMDELYAVLIWHGYHAGLSWAAAKEIVLACKEEADAELERTRPVLPLPGAVEFIAECYKMGIPLGVVTADETAAAEKHLQWLGIRHYFGTVIGNDLAERGKPFPDMMEIACSRLSIACSQTAIIGDTNGDMRMGRAAGAAVTIGIAGTSNDCMLPDAEVVIPSFSSLRLRGSDHEN